MGIVASGLVHQKEIAERISRLEDAFSEDISRIDFRYGEDWTGDPSIFLTAYLTAQGGSDERFRKLVADFPLQLVMQVDSEEFGLHSYFDFVSGSRQ
jgi:hypothetical protein